jgi:hypothetical protein
LSVERAIVAVQVELEYLPPLKEAAVELASVVQQLIRVAVAVRSLLDE